MMPSTPFNLPFASNGVDVHVRAGSIAGYVVGLVLSLDGITFTGIGAASMVVWEALGQPRVVNNTRGALLPIGGVFLGMGIALAAVGIPLWLANHTQVDISEHRAATVSKRFELTPEG
jgi:tetrahydromethanopterin S-methyltransferase subunit C